MVVTGRRRWARSWFLLVVAVSAAVVLAGGVVVAVAAGKATRSGARGDVGNTTRCPNRIAYCPAEGAGVSWPGRPALSPSGKFRLEVTKAGAGSGGNWQYQIVEVATGEVVLPPPRPAMIGGLGVLAAWDRGTPDTVWVTKPQLTRWRLDSNGSGQWLGEAPSPGEQLPPVVTASLVGIQQDG